MLKSWIDGIKRKPRKVTLTGKDVINLRSDVDHLKFVFQGEIEDRLVTLREDVNFALSGTAKVIYKLEALEERMVTAEEKIKLLLK